jgi:glycosyltransferase involved in cell wall biosynthesis
VLAIAANQHFAGLPPRDLSVELVDIAPQAGGLRRLFRPNENLARGPFSDRVRELAGTVDVVHLEQVATAGCDRGLAVPSVVHVHYRVRRDHPLGPPWRNEFRWVASNAAAERRAIRRQRYLLASSPLIAADLAAENPRAQVVRAPLSLDPQYYRRACLDGPPVAGIIGSATWPTTAAAVRRLVHRVWPRVVRHVPEARLLVAGRGMESLVHSSPAAHVEVVGEVPSSALFLEQLSTLVFPLERGSGMKVKVLESLAAGVPVVTTPSGSEGVEDNGGVVVRERDDELADAVVQVLRDARERRERGALAHAIFLDRYSPRPATEPVVDMYAWMLRR